MQVVLTHVSPIDRRERIYAGWVAFIDAKHITIINDGEHKAFRASELTSIITIASGEEASLDSIRAHFNIDK